MSKTAGRWEFFLQDPHSDDGSFYFEFVAGILKKLHITEGQELETSYHLNIQDTLTRWVVMPISLPKIRLRRFRSCMH